MKQILFVNACMRGPERSRTWGLARTFLDACQARWPQAEILERDLTDCALPVLSGPMTDQRDRCFQSDPQNPMFAPAREMSRADLVVVAAPYWDLSFPAALKIYLEWASVLGITFHYTDQGVQEGLCRADHLVYVTTAGGVIGDKNFGFDYLQGLGEMFGIPNAHLLSAQGLDIWGNDPQSLLNQAKEQARLLAGQI